LDLISSLNENSIRILSIHAKYNEAFLLNARSLEYIRNQIHQTSLQLDKELELKQQGFANNVEFLEEKNQSFIKEKKLIEREKTTLEGYQVHGFYGISEEEFEYLKQILSTKALMLDFLIGTFGYVPFKFMRVTRFGKEFINFLKYGELENS